VEVGIELHKNDRQQIRIRQKKDMAKRINWRKNTTKIIIVPIKRN